MTTKNNHKQDISIAHLEERLISCEGHMGDVERKVDAIIENHLPHIETSISRLDANQKIVLAVLMMMIGGLISLFFK